MNAALHIHHLNEERFPVFSNEYKQSAGEYILPFIERVYWSNLSDTILRMLTKWESLFLDMKNAGAVLELQIRLTRKEQKSFICLEFQISPALMQVLNQLEISPSIQMIDENFPSNA